MSVLDGIDFDVSRVDGDDEVVVSVAGEVDFSTAPRLSEVLAAALDGDRKVIIDLTAMSFIDSQGIWVLVEAYKANPTGHADRLVIRSPRPQARKVLEITGIDKLLKIEG
jgi:anti-sigma B factor antagonist